MGRRFSSQEIGLCLPETLRTDDVLLNAPFRIFLIVLEDVLRFACCRVPYSLPPRLPLPSTLIAISPAADMAMNNPAMWANAPNDIFLQPKACVKALRLWAGMSNPTDPIPESILSDPRLNPMAADLTPLIGVDVKLIVTSGTWDVLHPDVLRFVEKCEQQGVGGQTTYIEGEHMFHGFPVAYDTSPEARKVTDIIVGIIESGKPFRDSA